MRSGHVEDDTVNRATRTGGLLAFVRLAAVVAVPVGSMSGASFGSVPTPSGGREKERAALRGTFRSRVITLSGCGSSGGGGASSNGNPATCTVGGAITGLGAGTGLVLANGSDTLKVPPNATSFTMPTSVANGQAYDLTVKIHPTVLYCGVVSGSGTVNGANGLRETASMSTCSIRVPVQSRCSAPALATSTQRSSLG